MGAGAYATAPEPERRRADQQHEADHVEERAEALALAEAEALAEGLVPEDRRSPVAERLPLASALPLKDVREFVAHFDTQEEALVEQGLPFPCVAMNDGSPLPVALPREAISDGSQPLSGVLGQLYAQLEVIGLGLESHDPGDVRGFFRRRLATFLSPRVRVGSTGEANKPPQGFPFRVETPGRSGLRVHYSPSCFLDSTKQFGNTLSTPVSGHLPPGRFVFGLFDQTTLHWEMHVIYRIPGVVAVAQL